MRLKAGVEPKAEINRLLDELACQGLALLVISSELPDHRHGRRPDGR